MALPKTLCFCASLEAGGIILGWIGVILSFLSVVMYAVLLTHADEQTYAPLFATLLGYNILLVVSSIGLIFGTLEKKPGLLLLWLTSILIEIIFGFFGMLAGLATSALFLWLIIPVGLKTYFWLVVLSLYHSLKINPTPDQEQNRGMMNVLHKPLQETTPSTHRMRY